MEKKAFKKKTLFYTWISNCIDNWTISFYKKKYSNNVYICFWYFWYYVRTIYEKFSINFSNFFLKEHNFTQHTLKSNNKFQISINAPKILKSQTIGRISLIWINCSWNRYPKKVIELHSMTSLQYYIIKKHISVDVRENNFAF